MVKNIFEGSFMMQNKTERLRKLEEIIDKLKIARIRADERLSLLRKERNILIKELELQGISPKDVKNRLIEMADEIDKKIEAIEAQIPPNLEELLNDKTNTDRE